MILSKYRLCYFCIYRLFENKINQSSHNLRKKINTVNKTSTQCCICKNIFQNIKYYTNKILEISGDYEFSTFLIGLKLKSTMIENDDDIKSKFRLSGSCSIKSCLNKEISKRFSRITKKTINTLLPDILIIINLKNNFYTIRSRTVYVYGKYIKKDCNIKQKQDPCKNCYGKGCVLCDYMGFTEFNSVEGKIIKILHEKFSATKIKINCIGSEDKSSLVLGKGRPFFAKIINPKKRKIKLEKFEIDKLKIYDLRNVEYIPKNINFKSKIKFNILTENTIVNSNLQLLDTIKSVLVYSLDSKINIKRIYNLKYRIVSSNVFYILMTIERGFPIKKFVDSELVIPNINNLINNKCKCTKIDYHGIYVL